MLLKLVLRFCKHNRRGNEENKTQEASQKAIVVGLKRTCYYSLRHCCIKSHLLLFCCLLSWLWAHACLIATPNMIICSINHLITASWPPQLRIAACWVLNLQQVGVDEQVCVPAYVVCQKNGKRVWPDNDVDSLCKDRQVSISMS